ncbi:MAG TPA: energy transducer TonB [Pyrinomonadaceae bacterium]|nr:energy transducer TonB [Pyrinomonadaceae bacterium]
MKGSTALSSLIALLIIISRVTGQTNDRLVTVAVLDLGSSTIARLANDKLRQSLAAHREFSVSDSELTAAAARGTGYSGSLNLSLSEARDLGAVLAADFYLLGDAQTLRRSSSTNDKYFESYCTIFLISSRTGRLIHWERPSFRAETDKTAEAQLLNRLSQEDVYHTLAVSIRRAQEDERNERALIIDSQEPVITEAPDDDQQAQAEGLRLPKPYRRLRPEYPDTAATADAEATVDALVDVGADGEVSQVRIARWAGFGLDEATLTTVRQLHFFPAMKNGTAVPMRVLLRYNFRKSAK